MTSRVQKADVQETGHRSATRRRNRRLALAATALVPVLAATTAVGTSPAGADPSTGRSIERVKNRIESLQHKAEDTAEEYLESREHLRSAKIRVKAARERLRQQHRQVVRTRENLGRLAAQVYQDGELSTLAVALGDDPDGLLARAGLTSTVAERQQALAERLAVQEAKLRRDAAAVTAQEESLQRQSDRIGRVKATLRRQIRAADGELNRLKSRQRAELLRASRSSRRSAPPAVADAPVPGSGTAVSCGGVGITAPSERVADVLRFACAQLGDPYRWAAGGPDAWDCSGFTRGAWGAANVSLPHSSRLQFGYGRHVARDSLLPGDLVFFYSPISHVGIYVGGGMMIHAPHSGDVVKIGPVLGRFVGATRL